jgi:cell division protein FtsW
MRIKEAIFIVIVFLASAAGFFAVLPESRAYQALVESAKINAPFLLLSILMSLTLRNANEHLLPVSAALTSMGMINLYQIKPVYYEMQLRNLYASFLVILIVSVAMRRIRDVFSYKYIFGVLSIIFFLSPIFFGKEIYGARLWVSLFGISFQPAEIARIFFFIFLSGYFGEHIMLLERRSGLTLKTQLIYLIPVILMTLFSLLSLVVVKDLGYSFLLLSTLLAAIYIAGARRIYIVSSLLFFAAGTYGAYHIFSHVRSRIDAWLNPWKYAYGKSFQVLQAVFAYAEGGITGRGLSHGFPQLIPAAHTDMVLPVFAESTGFLGTVLVVSTIALISIMLFGEAAKIKDARGKIFLSLSGFSFFFQSFLVAAGSMLLLPLTGLTIPFFSYGGSSLLGSLLTLYICLDISSRRGKWIVT